MPDNTNTLPSRLEALTRWSRAARTQLRERPVLGVGLAIGGGLGLAAMIGAAEAAVALSAGLLAYQSLTQQGRSAAQAKTASAEPPPAHQT